jgi:hypothetical protein
MSDPIADHIRELVAAAPPLNADQLLHLAALLRPDMPVGISKTGATAKKEKAK